MMKKSAFFGTLLTLLLSSLVKADTLKPGPWRFELRTPYAPIPFIIEFTQVNDKFNGTLKNGKELIELSDIAVTDKAISIPLQTYESSLELSPPKDGTMSGYFVRHNKNPIVKIPVFAVASEAERFPEEKTKPKIKLNGRWSVKLTDEDNHEENGVVIFEQKGSKLSGTILTPTGDYRYFEGFVAGHEFEAASFDGSYNYLFKGRLKEKNLEAQILATTKTRVQGKKDPKATLPDAYAQTQLEKMNFEFPDLEGKKVGLTDPKFKDKPVIVQFFGSWCPNCLDEMNYFIPWYNQNHQRGIEIVALAFERSLTPEAAKKQLLKTKNKKNIPYTLLIAGTSAEDKPKDKIPTLKNFISFPTTVFLNKKHEVVKVHAGFTGPSTGKFYEKWKEEFNTTVNGLLK